MRPNTDTNTEEISNGFINASMAYHDEPAEPPTIPSSVDARISRRHAIEAAITADKPLPLRHAIYITPQLIYTLMPPAMTCYIDSTHCFIIFSHTLAGHTRIRHEITPPAEPASRCSRQSQPSAIVFSSPDE
jgi:hypothetical protein